MNTMKWLIRREFWENRSFLWAPLIAAVVYLAMGLLTVIASHHAISTGDSVQFHSNLAQMVADASDPDKATEVSDGVQVAFQMFSALPLIVGMFVVFFYCLGCLYDERKDKSILFWKSLPVSDRDTVLAKVASAMVVAPVMATAIAIASALCLWMIVSGFVLLHGQSPMPLWNLGGIAAACANLAVSVPVTALWALPTIGWLMLCSAWARRVPFLWATVVPIVGGVMLGITGLMGAFRISGEWYWSNIVGRILFGLVPGAEKLYRYGQDPHAMSNLDKTTEVARLFSASDTLQAFTDPQLWLGVAVGAAMIYAAIRLRRWRDEG